MLKNAIDYISRPCCFICKSTGQELYQSLKDNLYCTPGAWSFYICRKCELVWLNPMPLESDISIAYKNYYTHDNDTDENKGSFIRTFYNNIQSQYLNHTYGYHGMKPTFLKNLIFLDRDRLEQTRYDVMYLENKKGKILDIGCGSGSFLNFMKKQGWETTGIDFDVNAVKAANQKNLNVKLGTLKEQNFPANYFDAITLSHVIEHVYDPVELLEECNRVLKPKGLLVISTPNNASLGHKYFKERWRGLEPPRHIHIFSPLSLTKLMNLSGVKKFRIFTSGRISRSIYRVSSEPKLNHHQAKISHSMKIKSRLFSALEWLLIILKKPWGEEVVVIVEK